LGDVRGSSLSQGMRLNRCRGLTSDKFNFIIMALVGVWPHI